MLGLTTIAVYLLATGLLAAALVRASEKMRIAALGTAVLAVLLHGIFLASVVPVAGGFDVNFFNSLSLVSWLAVLFIVLTSLRWETLPVGMLAFPGTAAWILLQLAVTPAPVILSQAPPLSEAHVVSSLVAYAILSIAALNALVIAAQDRILRHHRGTPLLSLLPPLTTMEHLLFQLIGAGWVVLTLSLLTGVMFLDENLLARHLAHKSILSAAAWIVFGLLLLGRWRFGWRGRTAVTMTLTGMGILLLAYFGTKLVLELILDRSWLHSAAVYLSESFPDTTERGA